MPNDFISDIFGKAKKKAGGLLDRARARAEAAEGALSHRFRRDKTLTVYPTYGYLRDDQTWVIPLRVWVSKQRRLPLADQHAQSFLDRVVDIFREDMGEMSAFEVAQLRARIADFVADDDSGEVVQYRFDDDPTGTLHTLPAETDHNGLVRHPVELPAEQVREWAGGATPRWLGVTAVAEGFEGAGRIRLASPEGLSVISDIDDTIKITEVPAGKRIVLRNAFLRDYHFVNEMRDRYRQFGEDVVFHYVSGSPWQLYDMLSEFLVAESQFPPGAFHMKNVRKNLLAPDSWQDFKALASGDEATLDQKVGQISDVIRNLPGHRFILVGDSGEKDPEVYRKIKNDPAFASQIQKIIIRDVVNAEAETERLKGLDAAEELEVVPAEKIVHGVSQFE